MDTLGEQAHSIGTLCHVHNLPSLWPSVPWTMPGCLVFPLLQVEAFPGRFLLPQAHRLMSDYPFLLQAGLGRPGTQLKGTHSSHCQAVRQHMTGLWSHNQKHLELELGCWSPELHPQHHEVPSSEHTGFLGQNQVLKSSSSGTSLSYIPREADNWAKTAPQQSGFIYSGE